MARKQIPVFLFTGFLDAGKTTFIQNTLGNRDFTHDRRTLLLICEQGEMEYDPTAFGGEVLAEYVENEEQLTEDFVAGLVAKHSPHQVMVEYNGMWNLDTLYRALAYPLAVAQEFAFFDAKSILVYNANMRTQVVDKLRSCDLAVFNRVEKGEDVMPLHRLVRGVSRMADIVYDHPDGTVERDEIVDPLPFDKNAPMIEIADEDYALFYRDMGENLAEYEGKTVKFRAMVAHNPHLRKGEMAVGRLIMTCCADDATYSGLVCRTEGAHLYGKGEWVFVTARVTLEKHPLYSDKGPVLVATSVARTDPPREEMTTFA